MEIYLKSIKFLFRHIELTTIQNPHQDDLKPVAELESELAFYLQYFTDQNFPTLIPDSLTGVREIFTQCWDQG